MVDGACNSCNLLIDTDHLFFFVVTLGCVNMDYSLVVTNVCLATYLSKFFCLFYTTKLSNNWPEPHDESWSCWKSNWPYSDVVKTTLTKCTFGICKWMVARNSQSDDAWNWAVSISDLLSIWSHAVHLVKILFLISPKSVWSCTWASYRSLNSKRSLRPNNVLFLQESCLWFFSLCICSSYSHLNLLRPAHFLGLLPFVFLTSFGLFLHPLQVLMSPLAYICSHFLYQRWRNIIISSCVCHRPYLCGLLDLTIVVFMSPFRLSSLMSFVLAVVCSWVVPRRCCFLLLLLFLLFGRSSFNSSWRSWWPSLLDFSRSYFLSSSRNWHRSINCCHHFGLLCLTL